MLRKKSIQRQILAVEARDGDQWKISVARSHSQLAAENLFLRKQLAFYVERQVKPWRADDAIRITLVALSSLIEWRRILTIVKPDTLIGWHRKGFRLFWRRKSKPRGRPRLPSDLRQVIAAATPAAVAQLPYNDHGRQ